MKCKCLVRRLTLTEPTTIARMLLNTSRLGNRLVDHSDESFRKLLLLAAASYFEYKIQQDVDFVREVADGNERLVQFVENKALERQYHTFFEWKRQNANKFFGLFGESFKESMQSVLQSDSDLRSSIFSFMEVGRERNRLVHENFGAYRLIRTSRRYINYIGPRWFSLRLPDLLRNRHWFPVRALQDSSEF